jgi:hypothetical protein
MKKIVVSVVLFGAMLFSAGNGVVAEAEESSYYIDGEEIQISENTAITMDMEEIENLLSNSEVEEVIYLDPNLLEEDHVSDLESEIALPSSRAVINRYRVKNVKNASDTTASGAIAAVSGGPGINLAIKQTKSVATTTSAKFGASDKIISAEVGWSTTGTTSISISGSYTVPKTVSGKKVKSCKLSAHTIRKRKSFVVDKMAWNSTKWVKQGTGYVSKAYGVSFKKTFTYK